MSNSDQPALPQQGANCQNCLFFRHQDKSGGTCHRYPPSFAGDSSPKENHHWKFPVVNSHSWCGEHKLHAENGDPRPLPQFTPE